MTAGLRSQFEGKSLSLSLKSVQKPDSSGYYSSKSRWLSVICEGEKRQCQRRPLRCMMVLIDTSKDQKDEPSAVPAECFNICEGGLYAIVPIGYGVAMGQHYTFSLSIGERGPEPGTRQVVYQHGKIVRTELLLGETGSGDRIGIGVQLYGHRTGCISMPANPL